MCALRNIRVSLKRFDFAFYTNYASAPNTFYDNRLKQVPKTEANLKFIEDPDTFGTLSTKFKSNPNDVLEDEGDIKEQEFLEKLPLPSQKLTIKQYADLIKQYIKHKRLKEAIDVLEVRMLKEDRVKPENYIYNILIGACADVGYTKKAFKLFNDMKRRALKPTGDTYTCLFEACINSPWPLDGLKNAKHLRELMIEKGVEPNLTNYNVMIKAFGRCGDLPMAFKIVDEMISKKIKIRVHTFNHLLHACINDKEHGLRHALLVWRKMLSMREKPNVYTFNLMLKCVKDCNLGSKEDIKTLIEAIQDQVIFDLSRVNKIQIELNKNVKYIERPNLEKQNIGKQSIAQTCDESIDTKEIDSEDENFVPSGGTSKEITVQNQNSITLLPKEYKKTQNEKRMVPNLLSKLLQLNQVLSLQEVETLQDKFAIVGGQEDFLKEMEALSVKPDIKTFTQMLPLIDESRDCELNIIEKMKSLNVKPDIDFYNMLIKKRCLRMDYDGAFLIKELIENEVKNCKNSYQRRKAIKCNILTYGVLAMACKTQENAEKLLNEMKEKQLKINIEILGTLLRHGTAQLKFPYVLYIMDILKEENLRPNEVFLKHLEAFHDKCVNVIHKNETSTNKSLSWACKSFLSKYKTWLKDVHIEEEHPWKQFMEPHSETVQRDNIEIKEPKRFYKRNRQFIRYAPRV
ncbi:Pentatricopeptide repeat-containing protein 1 [Papilio xuthus]|uniref:Pentatricopeptide repeat-containing protein 1 n=1 Tax=Papilio xuthus TaxID=66420 RepID=A0A194PKT8_PAPXU|nr:Pentatricopeptide repeat-containing protein 1 [Papilio xuthus]